MPGIKNKHRINKYFAGVHLFRSHSGISIKLKLLHLELQTPCSKFKGAICTIRPNAEGTSKNIGAAYQQSQPTAVTMYNITYVAVKTGPSPDLFCFCLFHLFKYFRSSN